MPIKLQTSPGPHQCVAACLQMVTFHDVNEIVDALYTNGCPFPPPWDKFPKGPTMDEVCDWIWCNAKLGLMPFHRNPTCSVNAECPSVPVWPDGEGVWLAHLDLGWGLLEGSTGVSEGIGKIYHMCAWDGDIVYDPRGYEYAWEEREQYNFDAQTFWLVV